MTKIIDQIWGRIISATELSDGSSTSYRRIFSLVALIMFIPDSLFLSELPDALFDPPRLSPFVFLSGYPGYWFLLILHLFIILGLLFIGLDRHIKLSGIVVTISFLILDGYRYSLGKVDHGILLPVTIFFFSLVNWKKHSKDSILPIPAETLIAVFIAFGMFTAGIQKAIIWIDFDSTQNGFISWFFNGYFQMDRSHLLSGWIFNAPNLLLELFDYTAVLFELSPFIILLTGNKKLWKYWLIVACAFHTANLLFLNISFHFHLLIYLAYLIPIGLQHWIEKISLKVYASIILLVAISQIAVLTLLHHPIVKAFIPEYSDQLIIDLILWLTVFFIGLWSIVSGKSTTAEESHAL